MGGVGPPCRRAQYHEGRRRNRIGQAERRRRGRELSLDQCELHFLKARHALFIAEQPGELHAGSSHLRDDPPVPPPVTRAESPSNAPMPALLGIARDYGKTAPLLTPCWPRRAMPGPV